LGGTGRADISEKSKKRRGGKGEKKEYRVKKSGFKTTSTPPESCEYKGERDINAQAMRSAGNMAKRAKPSHHRATIDVWSSRQPGNKQNRKKAILTKPPRGNGEKKEKGQGSRRGLYGGPTELKDGWHKK